MESGCFRSSRSSPKPPNLSYARYCPEHRCPLEDIPPVKDYGFNDHGFGNPPELHCSEGNHLVGVVCDTDYWLVVHVESGLICFEANEDGHRFVNFPSLMVGPEDLDEPSKSLDNVDVRLADAANWKRKNLRERAA